MRNRGEDPNLSFRRHKVLHWAFLHSSTDRLHWVLKSNNLPQTMLVFPNPKFPALLKAGCKVQVVLTPSKAHHDEEIPGHWLQSSFSTAPWSCSLLPVWTRCKPSGTTPDAKGSCLESIVLCFEAFHRGQEPVSAHPW